MLEFSPEKMAFIFLIVLLVLGPEKLPEVSRKIGKAMGELRKLSGGFQDEMRKAVHEVSSPSESGSGSSTEASSSEATPEPSGTSTSSDESSGS
jgi:Sec-independent protein translocase protein TatA